MLKFVRNKLVSIQRKDKNTLTAHGVLEDDIYGLEIDVTLSLPDLEILSIEGKWGRTENSECPRAIPFLQEAVGLRMGEGFSRGIQKSVGRKACPHFANILLECCHAARDAAMVIQGETEKDKSPGPGFEEFLSSDAEKPASQSGGLFVSGPPRSGQEEESLPRAGKGKKSGGMIVDLHVHTLPASPCSSVPVGEIIAEAKKIGLDAICLTEHNHVWDPKEVAELSQKYDFLILRGNEITTDQGDMIVFGLEKDVQGIVKLEELRKAVSQAGGFMIVAHPFRGFLTFGVGKLGLTPEKAMERPLFKLVDGVEVLNSKVTKKENDFAARVAAGLRLPATGGSDAHEASAVGIYATRFSRVFQDEKGLIEALKSGDYSPIAFRGKTSERSVAIDRTT
ncbi:MAG: CehA/McbA family metallohydrolase [Syntrophaceae bacterium]|nr:CehA/McbA family metallohydrolase [Syntrophaceae bacterium]